MPRPNDLELAFAWDSGFSARRCGSKDSDNPYALSGNKLSQTIEDKLHYSWSSGWNDGGNLDVYSKIEQEKRLK